MRRRGLLLAAAAWLAVPCLVGAGMFGMAAFGVPTAEAPAGPVVTASCVGIDPGPPAAQIRVGLLVSGNDGLYRIVLAGPAGPVQGEGRISAGRGVVVVAARSTGEYANVVITDVDTGQSVDPGALAAGFPVTVGTEPVACDAAALVAPGATEPTVDPSDASTSTTVPTPGVSTAAPPTREGANEPSTDTPPWLLLLIPGVALVAGGVVVLVRARRGSRSR